MNKNAQSYSERRRGRRILGVILAIMTLLMVFAVFNASAAAKYELQMTLRGSSSGNVYNNYFSTDEMVAFGADKLFTINHAQGIKYLKVTTPVSQSSTTKLLDSSKEWQPDLTSGRTSYIYKSNNAMSKEEIQAKFNLLRVQFVPSGSKASQSGSLEITVEYGESANSKRAYGNRLKINFYQFAKGDYVSGLTEIGYDADGNSADEKKLAFVDPNATAEGKNTAAEPKYNSEGIKASFGLRVNNNFGAPRNTVDIGYQVKTTSETWQNADTVITDTLRSPIPNYYYASWWNNQSALRTVNITTLNNRGDMLRAGVDYDVRGVIITDGSASANYTEPFRLRYDKPAINSFNIGSLSEPFFGGRSRDSVLTGVFNNTNYDNQRISYTNINGGITNTVGATLEISTYFTDDFQADFNGDGTGIDKSVWSRISTVTWRAQNQFNPDDISRIINESRAVNFASNIDSQNCAMKVVMKDVGTGYSTFYITDAFMVDSNDPTKPEITAFKADGSEVDFTATDYTVGGAGAQVNLAVQGSTDAGSGLKEYNYAVYYVSTEDVNAYIANASSTTKSILDTIAKYTEQNPGYATYTSWTTMKPDTEGIARFGISKDGYYKVEARAVDNAGKLSQVEVETFRVDLSVPPTPQIRLVKNNTPENTASPVFSAYDSRTYTDSQIWLLINVPPMTGKTYTGHEFSLDNGLQWVDIDKEVAEPNPSDESPYVKKHPGMVVLNAGGVADVYYTEDVTDANGMHLAFNDADKERFTYQKAVLLPSTSISGYQSIVSRVIDKLGNTSLVSGEVLMRTTDNIQTSDVLRHEGIEVALSMGNTTMSTSSLTADLKNAAARKINEKYYGTTGSANRSAADFNPWLLIGNHKCTWHADDPGCTTPCLDPNCPYKLYGDEYEYYTPEMVNIQGISSADATSGNFNWKRYDHTSLGKTQNIAGQAGKLGKTSKYYEGSSYVLVNPYGGEASQSEATSGFGFYNGTIQQRYYHMAVYNEGIDPVNSSGSADEAAAKISSIGSGGYYTGSYLDWMFLYNEQGAKKTLGFTLDEAKLYAHSNDGYGFFYNTTIRQNKSGTWVMSGYLFYIAKTSSSSYTWELGSFRDAPVNQMLTPTGNTDFSTLFNSQGFNTEFGGGVRGGFFTRLGRGDIYNATVKHFRIITEGDFSTIWCYAGPNAAVKDLDAKFNADTSNGTNNGAASYTAGFKAITWTGGSTFTRANTPRPTVDSETIGVSSNANHTDTSAYGFGPFVAARTSGHNCSMDTRVIYSNMVMKVQSVRKLSEVVTEPQWGGGKAKYIVNLSDDSINDFNDAALTSAIQWRLLNDKAKFIGWGAPINEAPTLSFLDRIDGEGHYESTGKTYDTQIDEVSTYITTAYYKEFGFTDDQIAAGTISDAIATNISQKGLVYTLDDIKSHEFSVSPAVYNTSTANADYPAGRWFITHDITGYDNVNQSVRHNKYSDALELKVTEPGRWTVYFAPDPAKVANNTLDPADAVFDFVVSQRPVANFTGNIKAGIIDIDDSPAMDLDAYGATGNKKPMAQDYKFKDKNGVEVTYNTFPLAANAEGLADDNIQLNGITKFEWRCEILRTIPTVVNGEPASTLKQLYISPNWIQATPGADPFSGKTVAQISEGEVTELADSDVLTVYLRVTDTSSVKKAAYDAAGKFLGYYFVKGTPLVSETVQQNVTAGAQVTFSPMSSFQLSRVDMYDTAEEDTDNAKITVTRRSSHPQGSEFKLTWKIKLDGSDYITLRKDATTGDYWLDSYIDLNDKLQPAYTKGPVLKQETAPVAGSTAEFSSGGVWEISKAFIADNVKTKNKSMTLQINEAAVGLTAEDIRDGKTVPHDIIDSSARAVFFRGDANPPSAQNVTVTTKLWKNTDVTPDPNDPNYFNPDNWTDATYEASNYLDVTGNDKYIEIVVSGAKDAEGRLGGYSYYLYSKLPGGAVGSYYKLNPVTGVKTAAANLEAARYIAPYSSVQAKGDEPLVIRLSSKVMGELSSEAVSIAIQALDNQSPPNYNKESKVEDIKFTKSFPVAPGILVTDAENKVVAEITNKFGLTSENDGVDEARTDNDRNWYSRTTATIEFKPRTDKFIYDLVTGEYTVPTETDAHLASDYYLDITGAVDRTNTANIVYTLEKNTGTATNVIWTVIDSGEKKPAEKLSVTDSGEYRITARVKNGSKAESEPRSVTFKVDVTKPTGPAVEVDVLDKYGNEINNVDDTAHQQGFTLSLTGGTDKEDMRNSRYRYSIDGGVTWHMTAPDLSSRKLIDLNNLPTGEYNVRIMTIDPAGNESELWQKIIKIDRTPPRVDAPEISTESKTQYTYNDFVVKTSIVGEGEVWLTDNNRNTYYDTVTTIPVTKNSSTGAFRTSPNKFYVIDPADGYDLEKIMYNGVEYKKGDDLISGNLSSNYTFIQPAVTVDPLTNPRFETDIVVSFQPQPGARAARVLAVNPQATAAEIEDETEYFSPSVDYNAMTPDGKFTISARQNGGGVINNPRTPVDVLLGEPFEVSATASTGNVLAGMTINGLPVDMKNDSNFKDTDRTYTYRFANVYNKYEVRFEFAARPYRELYLEATGRVGTLTLSSETLENVDIMRQSKVNAKGAYEVYTDALVEIMATPAAGYALKSLSVNDETLLSGADQTTPYLYTYSIPKDMDGDVSAGATSAAVLSEVRAVADFGIASATRKVGISFEYGVPVEEIIVEPVDPEEPTDPEEPEEPEPGDPVEPIIGGTIWPAPETVDNKQLIYVPRGSTQTFTVTVFPGYSLTKYEWATSDADGNLLVKSESPEMDANRKVSFTIDNIMGSPTGGDVSLTLFFEENTYTVEESHITEQGTVLPTVYDKNGEEMETPNFAAIPEGASIQYDVEAKEGYRLINVTVDGKSLGAQRSFRLEGIISNRRINVLFEKRAYIDAPQDKHSITVVAKSVSDAESGLKAVPYSYAIYEEGTTPEYTAATDKNTIISADTLRPNRKYLVTVRAEDNVGNIGETKDVAEIYTKANQPYATGVQLVDDSGSLSKAVRLFVKKNGNPDNTKYLIRYSEYPAMDKEVEPRTPTEEDWKTLVSTSSTEGYIDIKGLDSGKPYYLTVEARNNATSPEITGASYLAEHIQYIVLSHPAPPEASFYFEEQTSPNGGIKLFWDAPPTDVDNIVIYKDGNFLASVPSSESDFTDYLAYPVNGNPSGTITGNTVYGYSYAYENDAGVGASRMAVSKIYREAFQANVAGNPAPLQELKSFMNSQAELGDQQMYEQILSYPMYPVSVERRVANIGATVNDGVVTVRVRPEETTTSRSQKYTLRLIAGQLNDDGEFIPDDAYNQANAARLTQTTSTQSNARGAEATWQGIYTDYKYKVQVLEVISSGPRFTGSLGMTSYATDGSEYGIEGTLGKQFIVSEDGYRVEFVRDTNGKFANALYKNGTSWTWSPEEAAAYVNPSDLTEGWSKTMDLVDSNGVNIEYDIIKFNTMPKIELPDSKDDYFDKDQDTYNNEKGYILIDKAQKNPTFSVNVAVWDTDSERLFVEGEIDGYKASGSTLAPPPYEKPSKLADYFKLNFAGANLKSGVYNKITVRANDTMLENVVELGAEGGLKIVVNQLTPQITIAGGAQSRKIELGSDFRDINFSAGATINSGNTAKEREQIRALRLEILEAKFKELYGTNDYEQLKTTFGSAAAANTAIDAVNPETTYMIQISEEIYNQVKFAADRDKYFRQETVVLGDKSETFYWADMTYALNNGICNWLTLNGAKHEVTGEVGKSYSIRVYSKFGNNESQVTTSFTVEQAPSLTILSEPKWDWQPTTFEDEYNHYNGFTVSRVASEMYQGVYNHLLPEEYFDKLAGEYTELAKTEIAAKMGENGEMLVFTLNDPLMTITQTSVAPTIIVETGVYEGFKRAGIMISPNPAYNPVTGVAVDDQVREGLIQSSGAIKNGTHTLSIAGLNKGTTYYVWSFYEVGNHIEWKQEETKITTASELPIAYYRLATSRFDFAEVDYPITNPDFASGRPVPLTVVRYGEGEPWANINVTAEYYKADEDGNFVNSEGEPTTVEAEFVRIDNPGLGNVASADRTLTLDSTVADFFDRQATTSSITMRLFDNRVQTGHMIVRLRISVTEDTSKMLGCNYISNQGSYADVYIQDEESPIKIYQMELMNNQESDLAKLEERTVAATPGIHYRYEFSGVDSQETREDTLTVKYANANGQSGGYINDITVGIYKTPRIAPDNISEDFAITDGPSMAFLPNRVESPLGFGTFNITPSATLSDGIHKAYVCLRSEEKNSQGVDRMKESDYIWIEVIRVVGQSTLSGRIYFGNQLPLNDSMTIPANGVAKVMLYPGTARLTSLGQMISPDSNNLPMYETYTDPSRGGYFEIKHILNKGQENFKSPGGTKIEDYYIVVEKDGFLTYNPIYFDYTPDGSTRTTTRFAVSEESLKYEFNLRMRAGDINGNNKIELAGDNITPDYDIFLSNFNMFYDLNASAEELEAQGHKYINLCDYNFDGAINVLDRLLIRTFMGTSIMDYPYMKVNTSDIESGGLPIVVGGA